MAPPGRLLLLPVVNSPDCEAAVRWCLDNAHKPGDRILLLHVEPYAQAAYSGVFLPPSAEEVETRARVSAGALKARFGTILEEAEVPYDLEVVKAAGAADDIGALICRKAAEADAACVIMGAHEGSLKAFFVGSVTQHCVKHCSRPVIVVRC